MSPLGDALLWRPDLGPVLIASGGEGATRRYRAVHHAEQLELAGVAAELAPRIDAAVAAEAPRWPIVVLHRVAWDPHVAALVERTRDGGGIVLFDVDDLVFEPESTRWHHGVQALSPAEQRLYHDGVRRYRRTLLAADAAVVPTAALAARVRRAGRPAFVSRNCLDLELVARSARAADGAAATRATRGDRLIVGYASGTRTHDRDFAAACGPALRAVMARHPAVDLHLVGPLALDAAWDALAGRVLRRDAVDWRALPDLVAGWDVNLAPLEVDNLFCQCKSELKWLEAAACGVPTIASRTQAFASALAGARGDEAGDESGGGQDAGRGDGAPLGLLAVDEADWADALAALVVDPVRRAAIGAAARAHAQAHRTTAAQAPSYAATLAKAAERLRPVAPPPLGERRAEARLWPAAAAPGGGAAGRRGGVRDGEHDARRGLGRAARRDGGHGVRSEAARDGRHDGRRRIAVVVPEPPPGSGGHTSIFRMVAGLCDAGHDVTVHVDRGPLMQRLDAAEAARYLADHFPPSPAAVRLDRAFAGADVAIATAWTTAAAVAYAPGVGTRLYFVQDYEPFFQPLSADYVAAAQTYRLGLGHITLGPWLAEHIATRFGGRARAIDFGVEHALYRPAAGDGRGGAATAARPRIVFYARAVTPRRGVALGLAALAQLAARRPDVEIVLYGGEPAHVAAPFPHAQAGVLDGPALADLYRSATVGLALSYTNLSFVPLEMMACGLPVVVAATEPAAWLQHDGVNCAVAEPTADGLAAALEALLDDPARRRRLAEGGRAAVAGLSWERSVAQFVAHVDAYVAEDRAVDAAGVELDTAAGGADTVGDATSGRVAGRAPEAASPDPRSAAADAADAAGAAGVAGAHRPAGAVVSHTGPPAPRAAGRALAAAALDGGGARPLAPDAAGQRAWAFPLRPDGDGLYRLDLRFNAVDHGPAAGLVALRLKPHPSAPHDLATATVRATAIVAGDWTPFRFRPLADVAGRTIWAIVGHLPDTASPAFDPAAPPLALARAASGDRAGEAGEIGRGGGGGDGVGGDDDAVGDRQVAGVGEQRDAGDGDGIDAGDAEALAGRPAGAAPRPAYRAWRLDPVPAAGADDPAVFETLFAQRRASAELRRAAARRARRWPAARLIDAWAARTAPLPPVALRPWTPDAPARVKLARGLARYGLVPVVREAIATWRHRTAR